MHELGIVVQVVRTAQKAAEENQLTKVHKIVLQVGELCGAVPDFVRKLFPVAIHNNEMFEDCKLKVEEVPAVAVCGQCQKEYQVTKTQGKCPECGSRDYKILEGTLFLIKEIAAS